MQGNRRLGKDIIAGPFFIVGEDGDEFRSLTDEETKENLKRFAEPEDISQEEVENAMDTGDSETFYAVRVGIIRCRSGCCRV